jgi:hypothetical protein
MYTFAFILPLLEINQKHNTMERELKPSQSWEHFWDQVKPGFEE